MKVVIAGIRYSDPETREVFNNYDAVSKAVEKSGYNITTVISGHALGVDLLGELWALVNDVPIIDKRVTPNQWNTLGKAAGCIRNREMAELADAAVIVWDGKSKGTKNMIAEMNRLQKPYYLYMLNSSLENLL